MNPVLALCKNPVNNDRLATVMDSIDIFQTGELSDVKIWRRDSLFQKTFRFGLFDKMYHHLVSGHLLYHFFDIFLKVFF